MREREVRELERCEREIDARASDGASVTQADEQLASHASEQVGECNECNVCNVTCAT